jgi:hypothetical protein
VKRKGGGGGKGGGSSSGTKGGGTGGGKSSGSLKLPKGGPRGGGAVTHPYPGSRITIPRGGPVNHAPGEGNQGVVSWFEDDRGNLCPVMTDIGDVLQDGTCTVKGKPAMNTYDSMISAYDQIRQAQDPRGYDEAANSWVGHIRSLRETECGGKKVFQKGEAQEILGTAMDLWADWMENPKYDPA